MAVGHRQRVREKVDEFGVAALHDRELLEYILFPFIPRKDTAKIAAQLLESFGDLKGVMEASSLELRACKGMTDGAAQFLPLIPEFYSRAISKRFVTEGTTLSPRLVAQFLFSKLAHLKMEYFILVAVDRNNRFIKSRTVGEGDTISAALDVSFVAKFLLSTKAKGIIVAHNHPSASAYPSNPDIQATMQIISCTQELGVKLLDHIIVAGSDYFSFAETGICSIDALSDLTAADIVGFYKLSKLGERAEIAEDGND